LRFILFAFAFALSHNLTSIEFNHFAELNLVPNSYNPCGSPMLNPRHSNFGLPSANNNSNKSMPNVNGAAAVGFTRGIGVGANTSSTALFMMSPSNSNAQLVPQLSLASSTGTDGSKSELYNRPLIVAHQQQQQQQQHQLQLQQQHGLSSNTATNSIPPYSYQVVSLNESKAKGECKKRPLDVIW
jgi:hypothetical protein